MEFIPGATLHNMHVLGLPERQKLALMDDLLNVLEYLHPKVLHRDVKPANIKMRQDGSLVLLDFSLAKGATFSDGRLVDTRPGHSKGYADIRQVSHRPSATIKGDIYAAGGVLAYLVSGETPKDSTDRQSDVHEGKADPLIEMIKTSRVRADVCAVILRAMALKETERYPSIQVMRVALKKIRRRRRLRPLSIAFLLVLIISFSLTAEFRPEWFSRIPGTDILAPFRSVITPTALLGGEEITPVLKSSAPAVIAQGRQAPQQFLTPPSALAQETSGPPQTLVTLPELGAPSPTAEPNLTLPATVTTEPIATTVLNPSPTITPGQIPSATATPAPTLTNEPTATPSPTIQAPALPVIRPTIRPTAVPTVRPTLRPTIRPIAIPTARPTIRPTIRPTAVPTVRPTLRPTIRPTAVPTARPTLRPTIRPTATTAQIPVADGTYQGSTSAGGTITITIIDRRVRSVVFTYPAGVGPTLQGNCAGISPRDTGYESTIVSLTIRIDGTGRFSANRIAVRYGNEVRYLSLSGSIADGQATGNLIEDNPNPETSDCTHHAEFVWTAARP